MLFTMRQCEVKNSAEYDVFTRINEHYAKMSKGHKAIADYISEHFDQAVFMTAAKLGETLGISESTWFVLPQGSVMMGTRNFRRHWKAVYRVN